MKKFSFIAIIVILTGVLAFSGYQLWQIYDRDARESTLHAQLLDYKPDPPAQATDAAAPRLNQNIVDLQAKYPDAVGWISIPNTKIDYPFVQAKDNDFYLRRDIDGKYLYSGTLFMDYRDTPDFSGFNSIIYGHHMKNKSMFGSLLNFDNQTFFNDNPTGTITLRDKTCTVEFFAYIVLKPNDGVIYNHAITGPADKAAFLAHAKAAARYYRDVGVTADDHIVTLSTCDYEFDDARMVLLGKLTEA